MRAVCVMSDIVLFFFEARIRYVFFYMANVSFFKRSIFSAWSCIVKILQRAENMFALCCKILTMQLQAEKIDRLKKPTGAM